jgi:hypothetical protein
MTKMAGSGPLVNLAKVMKFPSGENEPAMTVFGAV